MDAKVRTRIAPSPTGYPHIGTLYQVLFNYAFAKKHNGQFIIRIEDTDRARFVEGTEQVIFDMLDWSGFQPDEDPVKGGPFAPYRQSERLDLYKKYALQLVDKGFAYYCFCSPQRLVEVREDQQKRRRPPMYDKHCRNLSKDEVESKLKSGVSYVIRMKIPENETIGFYDELLGDIEFDSNTIDDQILIKSDGYPTYHLAVVVDDHLMEISHIFRGREWVPSTPKQILLYKYLEWESPNFIHLPVILNADGKGKLSKRHSHASVDYYRQLGYLPQALLNYLAKIVWNYPGDEQKEIFSLDEFMEAFEIKDIISQGPRFDLDKLTWINGMYIRDLSVEDLYSRLLNHYKYKNDTEFVKLLEDREKFLRIIPLVQERLKYLDEFKELTDYFFNDVEVSVKELINSGKDANQVKEVLGFVYGELENVETWNLEDLSKVEEGIRSLVQKNGWKTIQGFMPIRIAVTVRTQSPPLFEVMEVLGKETTLNRLKSALVTL